VRYDDDLTALSGQNPGNTEQEKSAPMHSNHAI
jgi:hypothetical protein